ncbi:unnamed protein product [Paramecium octaurelia]|uniref:Uncharacterized protein n=1 Tax=Paramecium octaurelia TaxID=43137 RepID=A0A8S1YHU2_PAROT|nr:unnamed protein product [Paramecium octaurelia]
MYLPFTDQTYGNQQQSYKHETCIALAINNDNTMLLTGWDVKTLVHIFKQGVLKQFKFLNHHSAEVSTLNFCVKNSNIVSGSLDGSIVISSIQQIAKSKWIQKLKGLQDILCLVISPQSEDFIVAGSQDNSIKFWQCINKQFSYSQSIFEHSGSVSGLSYCQQEDKIISCGIDCLILLIEQVKNNAVVSWVVKQKIQVDQFGYRLSFINNKIFVFQPEQCNNSNLIIYTLNDQKQFTESNKLSITDGGLSCYYFFPLIYNNKKNILINKNNNYVNVIRVLKQGKEEECVEFRLEQAIDFKDNCNFGTLSNDGEYLVTWDQDSYKIQVRKYIE